MLADVGHPTHLPSCKGGVKRLLWIILDAGEVLPIQVEGGVVARVVEVEAAGLKGEGLEGVVGGDVPTRNWVGGGPGGGVPDGELAKKGGGGGVWMCGCVDVGAINFHDIVCA